ncbi:hypothetical protein QQF64_030046 [Cirrhinus molitorella]|uniref:Uncharacterized protein n=1 Tax=Cirrhinus molitorella TaxID=172907 RepID=A0ABR3N2K4_9TELE
MRQGKEEALVTTDLVHNDLKELVVIPAPGSELKQREADRHTQTHTERGRDGNPSQQIRTAHAYITDARHVNNGICVCFLKCLLSSH